jgi:hypothetical protein
MIGLRGLISRWDGGRCAETLRRPFPFGTKKAQTGFPTWANSCPFAVRYGRLGSGASSLWVYPVVVGTGLMLTVVVVSGELPAWPLCRWP